MAFLTMAYFTMAFYMMAFFTMAFFTMAFFKMAFFTMAFSEYNLFSIRLQSWLLIDNFCPCLLIFSCLLFRKRLLRKQSLQLLPLRRKVVEGSGHWVNLQRRQLMAAQRKLPKEEGDQRERLPGKIWIRF